MRSFLILLLVLNSTVICYGQDKQPKGEAVVERLLKSTVLIVTPLSEPSRSGKTFAFSSYRIGTGVYVGTSDEGKPVILTNYHVVRGGSKVRVIFASEANRLVGSSFSEEKIKDAYQTGKDIKLLARNHSKDMTLLELEGNAGKGSEPLPLASQSVRPGAEVHTMGCTPSVGLFSYTRGSVRSVGQREFEIYDERNRRNQLLELQAIETTNPLNKGDSGGPLVNNALELVGIAQSKSTRASLVTVFVDRHEIAAYIDINKVKLPVRKAAANPPAAGEAPAKDVAITEPKRVVDEAAAINHVAIPAAPIPQGPKSVLQFKMGFISLNKDQSWMYQEFHAGKIQQGKLTMEKKQDDELIFSDAQNQRWFRYTAKGLERSTNAKEWTTLDANAVWNR